MNAILTIALFYPILTDVWNSGPISVSDLYVAHEIFIPSKEIRTQMEYLDSVKDPRTRMLIVKLLGETNNKDASQWLQEKLGAEKDQDVLAESLRSIHMLRKLIRPSKTGFFRDNLDNPAQYVRLYAALDFLNSGGAAREVLKALEDEEIEFVGEAIWGELALFAGQQDLPALEGFLGSAFLHNRRGAAYLVGKLQTDAKLLDRSFNLVSKDDASVKIAFIKGIRDAVNSAGVQFLAKLSGDESVPVRSAVAGNTAVDRDFEETLLKLAGDVDFEVRRLACVSLGGYSDEKSVLALIRALGDPDLQVRTAAEDSLAKIGPGEKFILVIGKDSLESPASRNSAIRVLGLLGRKEYSDKIAGILRDASSGETIARAVRALGLLDHDPSAGLVASYAGNADMAVRKAVAWSLGRLNVEETYDVLRKLDKDSVLEVRLEAIKSIGLTGSSSFAAILCENLKEYTQASDVRTHACWAVARTFSYDSSIDSALNSIIATKVIPTMSGPQFDGDDCRASAMLALASLDSRFKGAGKTARNAYSAVSKLMKDPMSGTYSHTLMYYLDQAISLMEGRKPEAKVVPPSTPTSFFPVNRIEEGASR